MGTPTLPFRGKNPYILTGCSITPFVMGGPVTPAKAGVQETPVEGQARRSSRLLVSCTCAA
jgi:hypothetical protein